MPDVGIIGGTGLTALEGLEIVRREVVHTPYGEPSGALTHGVLHGKQVVFLARHGYGHNIPPHRINYRANIWALKDVGVARVIAVAAVGGIAGDMPPGALAVPDQLIDYTWGRASTFFDKDLSHVTHVDFTRPYDPALRQLLIRAGAKTGIPIVEQGIYGVTQGPRLETAAEIDRMERDGCSIVGMTAMPEAVLARELDLAYAACAVVANWAPGRGDTETIEMADIERTLKDGIEKVRRVLGALVPML